jgi:hypothetical protein
MTAPTDGPPHDHAIPPVVGQALADVTLPPCARLMMCHLAARIDVLTYRDVKAGSLAAEMRINDTTVGKMLTVLVERGYLSQSGQRRPRSLRMLWSRRTTAARDA